MAVTRVTAISCRCRFNNGQTASGATKVLYVSLNSGTNAGLQGSADDDDLLAIGEAVQGLYSQSAIDVQKISYATIANS